MPESGAEVAADVVADSFERHGSLLHQSFGGDAFTLADDAEQGPSSALMRGIR